VAVFLLESEAVLGLWVVERAGVALEAAMAGVVLWVEMAGVGVEAAVGGVVLWLETGGAGVEVAMVTAMVWLETGGAGVEVAMVAAIVWLETGGAGVEVAMVAAIVWLETGGVGVDVAMGVVVSWLGGVILPLVPSASPSSSTVSSATLPFFSVATVAFCASFDSSVVIIFLFFGELILVMGSLWDPSEVGGACLSLLTLSLRVSFSGDFSRETALLLPPRPLAVGGERPPCVFDGLISSLCGLFVFLVFLVLTGCPSLHSAVDGIVALESPPLVGCPVALFFTLSFFFFSFLCAPLSVVLLFLFLCTAGL